MGKFKEVCKVHFVFILKNIWVWFAVLGSTLFIVLFGSKSLIFERNSLAFVISFNHVNIIFPFLVMGFSMEMANLMAHGSICSLFDSYTHKNCEIFLGLFAGLFWSFYLISFFQFGFTILSKTWLLSFLSYFKCENFSWFLFSSFFNIFFLVALAISVGIIIKERFLRYLIIFFYQVLNLLFDNFTPQFLNWFSIVHLSGFKYHNYSSFAMINSEILFFLLSRYGMFVVSLLLLLLGYYFFKRDREKLKFTFWLAFILVVKIVVGCFLLNGLHTKVPINKALKKIEDARYERINLYMSDLKINGQHMGNRLSLQAQFNAINQNEKVLPLEFYLASNFNVNKIFFQGKELSFIRDGDLIRTDKFIESGENAICQIEYSGNMCEYVKTANEIWDYNYKLYAYVGPNLVLVPSCAGWYPRFTPIYNYIPETHWLYPSRVGNNQELICEIQGDFAIISNQSILYGAPSLQATFYDGIEYIHSVQHGVAIQELQQIINDRLIFLNSLIPMERVQVIEVPQNMLFADLAIENGKGRIIIGENSILNTAVQKEIDVQLDKLLFSGWFNLENQGFDYRGYGAKGGYPISTLPGNSFGSPDAYVLYAFYQYLYEAEKGSGAGFGFDEKDAFLTEYRDLFSSMATWYTALQEMVEYYEANGLTKTRELLNYFFLLEKSNNLTVNLMIDQLAKEENHVF